MYYRKDGEIVWPEDILVFIKMYYLNLKLLVANEPEYFLIPTVWEFSENNKPFGTWQLNRCLNIESTGLTTKVDPDLILLTLI
jgi:hypothetical protein